MKKYFQELKEKYSNIKNPSSIVTYVSKNPLIKNDIENFWKFPEKVNLKEKIYYYLFEIDPYCEHGYKKSFLSFFKSYRKTSRQCKKCKEKSLIKRKETNLKKYGVEEFFSNRKIREKIKETNLKKYGAENPFQSNIVKNKIKKTMMKKYGVEHPMFSKKIKQKVKQTNLKKYGTDNPAKTEKVKNKIRQTNLKKYGIINPSQLEDIKNKIKETNLKKYGYEFSFLNKEVKRKIEKTNLKKYFAKTPFESKLIKEKLKNYSLKKYGVSWHSQKNIVNFEDWENNFMDIYEKFNGNERKIAEYFNVHPSAVNRKVVGLQLREKYRSTYEKQVENFLDKNKINFHTKNRKILESFKELDFYIPEYSVALEFNSNFWHSEYGGNKNKFYHLNKTLGCANKGIRLIHIWEFLWNKKSLIYFSILSNIFGISKKIKSKNLIIKEISSSEACKFIKKYSLFEFIDNCLNIGLYDNYELLCIISLISSSKNWNIVNFCRKTNIILDSDMEILLLYFIEKYKPEKLNYLIDYSVFTGENLKNLGFEIKNTLEPQPFYTKDYINVFKNVENIEKYDKIWNCGYLNFEKTF